MAYELGVIGAGNMAEAIVRGIIHSGALLPEQIIVADIAAIRRDLFENQLKVKGVESNAQVAGDCRALLLSVKPQQAATALVEIGQVLQPDALVISIMAGISTAFIEKHLGGAGGGSGPRAWRVVRTMPNTPMLVSEGMVGIAGGANATPDDLARTRKLFEGAASVIDVMESQLDAVTAVSGSGPAYFFYYVEHLIRAGESLGLSSEQARQLAIKTAVGAARMLAETSDTPEQLRRKVTSPGGTTQAAISYLDKNEAGEILLQAVSAAARRSKELGV